MVVFSVLHQQFTQNNGDSVSCDRINRGKQPSFLPSAYTFGSLFFCSFSSFTPYHPPHTVCSSLTLFLTLVIIIVPLPPLLCRVVRMYIYYVMRFPCYGVNYYSFLFLNFLYRALLCVALSHRPKEKRGLFYILPQYIFFFSLLFLSDLKKEATVPPKKIYREVVLVEFFLLKWSRRYASIWVGRKWQVTSSSWGYTRYHHSHSLKYLEE